jgi:mRNA-degrading endonuclease RelE of RelBE toxin-antitoxin system
MNSRTTARFDREYARLPAPLRARADKQLALLLSNPHHPSLRIRRMEGYRDLWEGRITRKYRFIFQIVGETYLLLRIGPHDIERSP